MQSSEISFAGDCHHHRLRTRRERRAGTALSLSADARENYFDMKVKFVFSDLLLYCSVLSTRRDPQISISQIIRATPTFLRSVLFFFFSFFLFFRYDKPLHRFIACHFSFVANALAFHHFYRYWWNEIILAIHEKDSFSQISSTTFSLYALSSNLNPYPLRTAVCMSLLEKLYKRKTSSSKKSHLGCAISRLTAIRLRLKNENIVDRACLMITRYIVHIMLHPFILARPLIRMSLLRMIVMIKW